MEEGSCDVMVPCRGHIQSCYNVLCLFCTVYNLLCQRNNTITCSTESEACTCICACICDGRAEQRHKPAQLQLWHGPWHPTAPPPTHGHAQWCRQRSHGHGSQQRSATRIPCPAGRAWSSAHGSGPASTTAAAQVRFKPCCVPQLCGLKAKFTEHSRISFGR